MAPAVSSNCAPGAQVVDLLQATHRFNADVRVEMFAVLSSAVGKAFRAAAKSKTS